MAKEIGTLYVASNYGQYATDFDSKYKTCGWTALVTCADSLSLTYQRAYNYARKVNKAYGYARCQVEKLSINDWNYYYWRTMVENAK